MRVGVSFKKVHEWIEHMAIKVLSKKIMGTRVVSGSVCVVTGFVTRNNSFNATSNLGFQRSFVTITLSDRGIEANPDKIRAILDMPALRTKREIRGFLGLRHYMTKYSMHLISRLDPLGYLFDRPTLGRTTHEMVGLLETTLELGIRQMEVFGDSNLSRSIPTYYCLIDEVDFDDGLPWYHDIYQFMRLDTYPETMPLSNRVMREVHAGVCRPHMGGICLPMSRSARFTGTLFTYHLQSYMPPTSPWPFSVWGIDIIGKISLKSSSGHEFNLVAIDYFTKWVEATSYTRLTSSEHWSSTIPKANWAQARLDQLNLFDERRLRAADHVHGLPEEDDPFFKKRVKPRPLQIGDLVLKEVDPKGRCMVDGSRWKLILGAGQHGLTKEISIDLHDHPQLRDARWVDDLTSLCLDSPVEPFLSHSVGSPICPIESILESSGQTRCTSCYTGAYFPPLVVEMNVSSQICYGLHCFGREMFICVTGHGFDDFYRDEP
ncbi:hypothetical protein CK203_060075 [Vitis vinifera]|uniref:Mitochondrial protein n=1 Tax=Vitis vinifera TaxID=29760 RepID=A0A438GK43_VITVI|nr:hypothetical protein CK203_060075 [Vitis vinifera]